MNDNATVVVVDHLSLDVKKSQPPSKRKRPRIQLNLELETTSADTTSASPLLTGGGSVESYLPQAEQHQLESSREGPADLASNICVLEQLGRGAGGTVYLGCYIPHLKFIAVKQLLVYNDDDRRMITRELHALHSNLVPIDEDSRGHVSGKVLKWLFHHHQNIGQVHPCKYIVSFYGAYALPDKPQVSCVMEYMNAGSLQDIVAADIPIDESILKRIAYCTLKALDHMHDFKMIHRDIKPANILANEAGVFKIADFGLAVTLSKSKSFFSDFKGTMMYMAPERLLGQHYSFPSDIFAIGMVFMTLALGKYPYAVQKKDGFFGLEDAIVNQPIPELDDRRFSTECRQVITNLLQKDPLDRWTAREALDHAWFRQSELEPPGLFGHHWASYLDVRRRRPPNVNLVVHEIVGKLYSNELNQSAEPMKGMFQSMVYKALPNKLWFFGNCELERLAKECQVTTEYLRAHLQEAIQTHERLHHHSYFHSPHNSLKLNLRLHFHSPRLLHSSKKSTVVVK